MIIVENSPLSDHSTMRLGGTASFLCTVTKDDELLEALEFARQKNIPVRMIGIGSNIIWDDSAYRGLVIVNDYQGMYVEDNNLHIASGVIWDDAVLRSVNEALSGIEFLSLIPGTSGATPIQNVGAYGREISDTLLSLRAYDTHKREFVEIKNADCGFGYRTSRFKTTDAGRFYITSITLALTKENPKPPFYDSLQEYLDNHGIKEYTTDIIRKAVIDIRTNKLPDPKNVANTGSFFANPVITMREYDKLRANFPELKAWDYQDKMKLSAGWLLEQAGFKDYHDEATGMATWPKQSLVLVNESARSTNDLITFRNNIIAEVKEKFGITLKQEPELIS